MAAITRLMQYGEIFDGTIKEEIGQGSGGRTSVYRLVSDDGLESALKVIPVLRIEGKKDEFPNYKEHRDTFCERKGREVKIIYDLELAPHIMTYKRYRFKDWDEEFSFGCDLLIQMPLLENVYKLVMDMGPLPEDQIIILGKHICMALIKCHQKEVIHRDIKPHNIFRNKVGDYVLGDFGIAQFLQQGENTTRIEYTPPFAAPEQAQVGHITNQQTDIYSLGLTLYYLSNHNRLPFLSSTYTLDITDATKRRINGASLPQLKYCSKALSDIILKACAFRSADRFQSAEEFLYYLERLSAPPGAWTLHPSGPTLHPQKSGESDPYATAVASPGSAESVMPYSENDSVQYETEYARPSDGIAVRKDHDVTGDMYQTDMARPGDSFLLPNQRGINGEQAEISELTPTFKPDYSALETAQLAQLASEGDPVAQYRFGEIYFYGGEGISPNPVKAVGWFVKAAEQGDVSAQLILIDCYYNGTGVKEDHFEAIKWAHKAAEQGECAAYWALGVSYYKDDGVPVSSNNKSEAVKWFRMAAERGHAKAQSWLADCYYNGVGVLKDVHQAIMWYERAADLGDPDGEFGLALCYLTGNGVRKSPFDAIRLLRDAANQNHLGAQYYLGECYYAGFNGITIDHAEAFGWFSKAAMHGAPDAQYRLGDCFLYGIGTEKSRNKAIIWYKAAAKGGSPEAEEKLRELHVTM